MFRSYPNKNSQLAIHACMKLELKLHPLIGNYDHFNPYVMHWPKIYVRLHLQDQTPKLFGKFVDNHGQHLGN